MGTVLDTIAAYARERVAADKQALPLDELKERCRGMDGPGENPFLAALKRPGMSFICEIKKASPSKGVISREFPYLDIAREYERAGADAVSCLTEPKWFLGSDEIFRDVRREVTLPMLRKDFTVDEYQIYQAKVLGADAVLLICAMLDAPTLARYLELAHDLGLCALVEAHDEREIRLAVSAGAQVIGVNNRNLKDFSVDFSNAARLRELVPPDRVYVAESGVASPEDVAVLKKLGADAVLMGEVLMRAKDKPGLLSAMRKAAK
jgi:indole-3-glycerol phosphate synthase